MNVCHGLSLKTKEMIKSTVPKMALKQSIKILLKCRRMQEKTSQISKFSEGACPDPPSVVCLWHTPNWAFAPYKVEKKKPLSQKLDLPQKKPQKVSPPQASFGCKPPGNPMVSPTLLMGRLYIASCNLYSTNWINKSVEMGNHNTVV